MDKLVAFGYDVWFFNIEVNIRTLLDECSDLTVNPYSNNINTLEIATRTGDVKFILIAQPVVYVITSRKVVFTEITVPDRQSLIFKCRHIDLLRLQRRCVEKVQLYFCGIRFTRHKVFIGFQSWTLTAHIIDDP